MRVPDVPARTRRSVVGRLLVAVPLAVGGVPFLGIVAYLLLWWSPALSGPAPEPCDPAVDGWGVCWRPEQRTFWLLTAAALVPAVVCLVLSLTRLRTARRWWPLPVAAVVLGLACIQAAGRIS
jgi:hypothetical protein